MTIWTKMGHIFYKKTNSIELAYGLEDKENVLDKKVPDKMKK
jgi:hypothetical protein